MILFTALTAILLLGFVDTAQCLTKGRSILNTTVSLGPPIQIPIPGGTQTSTSPLSPCLELLHTLDALTICATVVPFINGTITGVVNGRISGGQAIQYIYGNGSEISSTATASYYGVTQDENAFSTTNAGFGYFDKNGTYTGQQLLRTVKSPPRHFDSVGDIVDEI